MGDFGVRTCRIRVNIPIHYRRRINKRITQWHFPEAISAMTVIPDKARNLMDLPRLGSQLRLCGSCLHLIKFCLF